MATDPAPNPSIEVVEGASGVLVGAEIVTMALKHLSEAQPSSARLSMTLSSATG